MARNVLLVRGLRRSAREQFRSRVSPRADALLDHPSTGTKFKSGRTFPTVFVRMARIFDVYILDCAKLAAFDSPGGLLIRNKSGFDLP